MNLWDRMHRHLLTTAVLNIMGCTDLPHAAMKRNTYSKAFFYSLIVFLKKSGSNIKVGVNKQLYSYQKERLK